MIEWDVQRGPCQTVDEFAEHAISLLDQQEAWLAERGTEDPGKNRAQLRSRATRRIDRFRPGSFQAG
jgi:hypothetical protein